MHLTRLSLTNVRSYRQLDVELARGIHVISGQNAAGKSNLLDAAQMLATTRSHRPGNDIDLINWTALADDPLPAARIVGEVTGAEGAVSLEVTVIAAEAQGDAPRRSSKRFRRNGVARRASDLIGQLRVVMFSADDLSIITGAPSVRRRYLDLTISQFDPSYVRALQLYNRVLQQRNSLLRRIAERRGQPDELAFWDDELAAAGTTIVSARRQTLGRLGDDAAARYPGLGAAGEQLEVHYSPALPEQVSGPLAAGEGNAADLAGHYREAIAAARPEDIRRGQTRFGPHRDDAVFLLNGHDAAVTASRGQQRTLALALRLSEVRLSTGASGEPPVLLLDDILSELDAHHRERVLGVAYRADQVLITSPDEGRPSREELPEASRHRLADGALSPG